MLSEDFYININVDIFYHWIILNQNKYMKHHINTSVIVDDGLRRKIKLEAKDVTGYVTIWNNYICEEEIFKKTDKSLLFYLHYKMINIGQCSHLFQEFYQALKSQDIIPPKRILLCCSGGLTTSLFASKTQELIALEKSNYEIQAIGYHQLQGEYKKYDALYLAPQISYLEPDAITIVHHEIPIYCVPPGIFARQDIKGFLDIIKINHPQ